MFWVARGLIRADRVTAVLKGTRVDIQLERGPEKKLDLKEVLLAMPDVGDDSVFERVPDLGRKVPEWGS